MPTNIKAMVSAIVAVVGVGALLLERRYGDPTIGTVAIALAVFMILAMWIFPEAKGGKGSKR